MLKFYEFIPAIMECLSDGKCYTNKEIIKFCCEKLKIPNED